MKVGKLDTELGFDQGDKGLRERTPREPYTIGRGTISFQDVPNA